MDVKSPIALLDWHDCVAMDHLLWLGAVGAKTRAHYGVSLHRRLPSSQQMPHLQFFVEVINNLLNVDSAMARFQTVK